MGTARVSDGSGDAVPGMGVGVIVGVLVAVQTGGKVGKPALDVPGGAVGVRSATAAGTSDAGR